MVKKPASSLPLINWLLPLVSGILLANYFSLSFNHYFYLATILIGLILLGILSFLKPQAKGFLYRILLSLGLLLLGMGRFAEKNAEVLPFSKEDASLTVLQVENFLGESEKFNKYEASVATEHNKTRKKIILYYSKDLDSLTYNELLATDKVPDLPLSPLNPLQFNYREYLQQQGYSGQLFIREQQNVLKLTMAPTGFLSSLDILDRIKGYLVHTLNTYLAGEERAIVKAMFLGDRVEMTEDLTKTYSNAGVMHILAVSGLHVGIIYIILVKLFSQLRLVGRKADWVKLFLIIMLLWVYVLLTGGRPSTFRAGLMFSIIAIGNAFNRSGNTVNSLLFAAFIMLVINPFNLWQVGFQLSYAAVIGIVYIQPRLVRYFKPKYKLIAYFWQVCAVTIAAQLATLPLTLHYFNQFPVYFIVANLLAIPIAFLIVCLALILVVLSWLPALASFVGVLLTATVWILNSGLQLFSNWANAVLEIYIGETSVILCYVAFLFLLLLWHRQKMVYAWGIGVAFLAISVLNLFDQMKFSKQEGLTVYALNRSSAMLLYQANSSRLLSDSLAEGQLDFAARAHLLSLGYTNSEYKNEIADLERPFTLFKTDKLNVLVINGKHNRKLTCITDSIQIRLPKPLIVLLSHEPRRCIAEWAESLNGAKLIVDGSNSFRYRKTMLNLKGLDSLNLHFTNEQGAYTLTY